MVTYLGGPNSNVDLSRLPGGQGLVVSMIHRGQGEVVASTSRWGQGQGEGGHHQEEQGTHIRQPSTGGFVWPHVAPWTPAGWEQR